MTRRQGDTSRRCFADRRFAALILLFITIGISQLLGAQAPSAPTNFRVNGISGGGGGNLLSAARQPLGSTSIPNAGWAAAGAAIVNRTNQCGSMITAYSGSPA